MHWDNSIAFLRWIYRGNCIEFQVETSIHVPSSQDTGKDVQTDGSPSLRKPLYSKFVREIVGLGK